MVTSTKLFKIIPYLLLGIILFAVNSASELGYFWKGSLVLTEAKIGIVVLYFLLAKINKIKRNL
jgi:hypothetical protein